MRYAEMFATALSAPSKGSEVGRCKQWDDLAAVPSVDAEIRTHA
jgi:hypothetical protein